MTVRLWQRPDKGHVLLVADAEEHAGLRRRYVPIHRLAAVAWGLLDGLDDDREVHHADAVPWHNAESNLEALDPDEHGRVTREIEDRRRAVATDGGRSS